MPEVEITPGRSLGEYRLTVDGVDLSEVVQAGGVSIQFRDDGLPPEVKLTLAPAQVRLLLPDANVTAAESYLPTSDDDAA